MRSIFAALLAAVFLFSGPGLADAAGKNKNKGKPAGAGGASQGQSSTSTTNQLLSAIITVAERALIGDYVNRAYQSGGLPPGLANRQQLPPGLQKHIQRTGRLPPGLENRGLPNDLLGLLPQRRGQNYQVVGNDIMLIEAATGLILDIMVGALR